MTKGPDSAGAATMQRAHVHEVGHLLGLGHVAIGQDVCPPTGDTNASACYGVNDTDKNSVMGQGMRLDVVHGAAWLGAFSDFARERPTTPAYAPRPERVRPATPVMTRIFPRTVPEFEALTGQAPPSQRARP